MALLFSNTQPGKDFAEHVFGPDPPDDAIHRRRGAAKIFGDQLPFRHIGPERRCQGLAGVRECSPMPFDNEQGGLARRHALFGQIRQGVKQPIDAGARFR